MVQDNTKVTSDEGVVKNYKDDEGRIKDGQIDKELIQWIIHLLSRQNKNREKVAYKTKQAKNWLKNKNKPIMV